MIIMNRSPIKRHESLKNLSREHHDGLIFAFRLQKGLAKKASVQSMNAYTDWFWEAHLKPHFKMEETHLFPMYGLDKRLVKKAKEQHQVLASLFAIASKSYEDFKNIHTLLQQHIRLEERELFMEIQDKLDETELAKFQAIHVSQNSCETWPDKFWKD